MTLARRIIERPGGAIELLAGGAGPPVVLVHASGMGAGRWTRLAARWVERYTLWAPGLVGYGATGPFDAATWSLADEVAVLGGVIEAIGRPAHVFGHSFGGLVSLLLAVERPALVQSLALYEPTVFGLLYAARDRVGLADIEAFTRDPRFLDPAFGGSDPWLGTFVDYWNQASFWEVMLPAQKVALRAVGAKVFAEVHAALRDRRGPEAWRAVTAPTRVLVGARTTPAADRCARLLAGAIPGADLVEIERAGHLAPLVRAQPIGDAVGAHFDRHEPR